MASSNLISLATEMRNVLSSPIKDAIVDKASKQARLDLLDMIPDLQRELLGPQATIVGLTSGPLELVSLQAITRWAIPEKVSLEPGATTTYNELAAQTGVNESQIRRIIRHAITSGIFHEPTKDHIAHTDISRELATNSDLRDLIHIQTDLLWPVAAHSVDAFDKWPNSQSHMETGVSIWRGKESEWFEEVAKSRGGMASFARGLKLASTGEGFESSHIIENYPWASFGNGTVVDIGGSNGHESIAIAEAFPSLNFVVQDISINDELAKEYAIQTPEHLRSRIKFMHHDFFAPQPIKDADVYFYRYVFHNWADHDCEKMLKALTPALKPGARILIHDGGVGEPGEGRSADEKADRWMDIMMMALVNGKEREVGEWGGLFNKADQRFKFLGASKPNGSRLWIVEAKWEP